MREILFRGKRVDNGEWVEGFLFQWIKRKEKKAIIGEGVQNGSVNGFEVYPKTVGQFTGLLDKNGVKIFEGDLLNIGAVQFSFIQDGKGHNALYEVKFQGCDFVLFRKDTGLTWGRLSRLDELCWDCLVIGNIHDSQELIGKENSNG